MGDALAAEGTVFLDHADAGPFARVDQIPHAHALDLVADGNAAHAADALGLVPDEGERVVPGVLAVLDRVRRIVHAQVGTDFLQFAVAVPMARGAVHIMLRQDQFHVEAPRRPHLLGARGDFHPFADLRVARRYETLHTLDFDDTDAAGADFVDVLQKTQGRNGDAIVPGRLQDGAVVRHLQLFAIDRNVHHGK